jgi:ribA/ribD-fused uncharacterized protein
MLLTAFMDDTRFIADFLARHNAGEVFKYVYFWGDKPGRNGVTASCFSQWYEAPFVVDGVRYLTAEHFMMAEKAVLFGDAEAREKILQSPTPGGAKAWGRRIANFDEAVWAQHRFAIVVRGNVAKFGQHQELGEFLRNTGTRVLVEASPIDPVWGGALAQDDARIADPNQWRGLNLLGFALMQVRATLV